MGRRPSMGPVPSSIFDDWDQSCC
ncbi:hypothetical protein CGCA056_v005623 [Colletotrichum aenigma]|nr:hypothetical protein CGCA056_v005623 [Colletotrichum aenigma]